METTGLVKPLSMPSKHSLAEELKGTTLFHTDSRIVRDQVSKYLVESYIVSMMKQIQDAIWPNGVLRRDPPPRTAKEKAKTKRDAGFKLATIFEGDPTIHTDDRFSWKYHGPCECSIWSCAIGISLSEYPFEYPLCIHCVRRVDCHLIPRVGPSSEFYKQLIGVAL
jgi:hypothetical protein